MANLYFSEEDLTNATNVIIEYLRDSGFEGSVESGTGIADIVIKPNALLYALFSQLVDRVRAYLSLQQATNMYEASELSEDEYDAAVDSILSNWFVTRNDGTPTYGTLRLWFSEPLSFLQYRDGADVGTCSNTTLVANGDQVFTEADFSSVVNATSNYNEYYVDVAVRSASTTDTYITADASATASVADIYYLRATVPASFIPGVSEETSAAFIERTRTAITTRELITDRAIDTVLRENFSSIENLYVAGHGDTEQLRDIVTLENGVKIHYGNKADIYIGSAMTRTSQTFTVNAYGEIDMGELTSTGHLGHILSIKKTVTDEETGETSQVDVPISSIIVDETSWQMPGYKPAALVLDAEEGTEVTLEWLTDPALQSIQQFVYSDDQRVVCYDPQVKHMFPVVLAFSLNIQLINDDEDTPYQVINTIVDFIDELTTNNTNYNMSELVCRIHDTLSNVRRIDVPLTCTATVFDPLSAEYKTTEVGNVFDYTEFGELSKQITLNTIQLYTDASLITVTQSDTGDSAGGGSSACPCMSTGDPADCTCNTNG